jgi:hypothetical protein
MAISLPPHAPQPRLPPPQATTATTPTMPPYPPEEPPPLPEKPWKLAVQEIAHQVILGKNPKAAIEAMSERVQSGKAPHLETYFLHMLWGKPKDTFEININQKLIVAALSLSDMELQAFVKLLEENKAAEALELLPETG